MTDSGPAFDLPGWKTRLGEARISLEGPAGGPDLLPGVLDELLRTLGREAGWDRFGCALVALGGYGRAEMAPHSDVDLLFLIRRDSDAGEVDRVLYPLWDMGLDVGHALRTPADCATMASQDLTVATALLDSRQLLGDRGLYDKTRKKIGLRAGGSRETRRWVPKLFEDVEQRRIRYGDVSHLLEPHIKEGSGGLRDLHASRWVLACLGLDTEEALDPSATGLGDSVRFLNSCRNALHAVAGRKTDHLTFEFHQAVADRVMPGGPLAEFFQHLHRASHHVVATWDRVASLARQELLPPRKRQLRGSPPATPGPVTEELLAWCRNGGEFPEDLRFAFSQGSERVMGLAVISAATHLLGTRTPLAPLLRQLHTLGKLGLFAPELDAVAHQVHYDARHAFTTGIHCIETLDAFERLWLGDLERTEPHLTRIASAILHPAAARLAALCHDLGKQDGVQGHEQRSAEVARGLALRLGMSAEDAGAAEHLARQHHVLPQIAFREDLEDPASWEAARGAAGDEAGLDTLVALAFADLLATNPGEWSGAWSDWKRDLLLHLHSRSREMAEDSGRSRASRLRHAVAESAKILGLGEVTAQWDQLPPREAEQVPPGILARLLHLGQSLGNSAASWHVESRGSSPMEVAGVVAPLPRVLGATTTVLTELGLDVLSFQVHTWGDGSTHLWFRVTPPSGGVVGAELARCLTGALTESGGDAGLEEPVRLPNRRDEAVPVQTRVHLGPGDNPFHSVLELRCRDRRGLIRDLARLFDELGLTVEYSLVTTHGPMAQDVFHLKDIFGGRVDGEEKRQALLDGVDAVARYTT